MRNRKQNMLDSKRHRKREKIFYYYRYSNKIVTVCKNNLPINYFHSEKEPILRGEIITVFGDFSYFQWSVLTGELVFQYSLENKTGILNWGLLEDNLVYIHKADRIILINTHNNGIVVKYINYHPQIIWLKDYQVIGCNKDSHTLYNLRE